MNIGPHWEKLGPCQGIPELQLLGYRNLRQAVDLPEHHHGDAFEFHLIEKGRAYWEVGENRYETIKGDIFHCRPNELHRGRYDVMEPCEFWWMILEIPHPERPWASNDVASGRTPGCWLGLPENEADAVLRKLWTLPRVVQVGPHASEIFRRLKRSLSQTDEINLVERRILVLDFLFLLLDTKQTSVLPVGKPQPIRRVCSALAERPSWRPTIAELASMANMSRSHFHRMFRHYTGMTPMTFLQRARIEEAIRRLGQTEDKITDIAADLGYATSQHFATSFRRITGRAPTEWRRECLAKL